MATSEVPFTGSMYHAAAAIAEEAAGDAGAGTFDGWCRNASIHTSLEDACIGANQERSIEIIIDAR